MRPTVKSLQRSVNGDIWAHEMARRDDKARSDGCALLLAAGSSSVKRAALAREAAAARKLAEHDVGWLGRMRFSFSGGGYFISSRTDTGREMFAILDRRAALRTIDVFEFSCPPLLPPQTAMPPPPPALEGGSIRVASKSAPQHFSGA